MVERHVATARCVLGRPSRFCWASSLGVPGVQAHGLQAFRGVGDLAEGISGLTVREVRGLGVSAEV